jgi:hypothetical protein
MPKLGDTFFLADSNVDSHPFVIISDPQRTPYLVVLANFTSWRKDKDQSCVVQRGEHPTVTKTSCTSYHRDRHVTATDYDRLVQAGHLIPNVPVSQDLLQRILSGAAKTDDIPGCSKSVLKAQGLI